jgi:hypothetical protein
LVKIHLQELQVSHKQPIKLNLFQDTTEILISNKKVKERISEKQRELI